MSYDQALAARNSAQADVQSAQANEQQAEINLGYTDVQAPFDGVVTARQVSIGQLVGATTPTTLATIVQLDPIWVTFNASERDVLAVREFLAKEGKTTANLLGTPVEIGLQTEEGYPHTGKLDYVAPDVDPSTGTLAARAVLDNANRALLPGFFVRIRIPGKPRPALLVPDIAIGSDQAGRYVLVVNKDNVVEQRKVEPGQLVGGLARHRERPHQGRPRGRRRHHAGYPWPEGRPRAAHGGGGEVERFAMISKFFIERPVLANVIAILMILIGAVAVYDLAIAQYPNVVPPTVQVTTRYPGASALTLVDTVALPIEQQVNGVEDMIYMQSTSASDGSYTLTVTFKIGTDLDSAQILVQNRVSAALAQLPQAVQAQGVTVQKRSTAVLLFVTLDLARQSL